MQAVLGNDYATYFLPILMPMAPVPALPDPTPTVDLLKFFHYATVLLDRQIINRGAYRDRKEIHIHNLLSRLSDFNTHGSI